MLDEILMGRLHDYRLFLKEFCRTFQTTGAVLPSGRVLAQALAQEVGRTGKPQRILEVGPGTGAVTEWIVRAMGPDDTLDMVELNDQFVRRLEQRFASESSFADVAGRARVLHCAIETLDISQPYDLIISGLPLNNFSVAQVEQILEVLLALLRPEGTLSFFEYIAIRRAKAVVSGSTQRQRLRGISRTLKKLFDSHPARHRAILPNIPPAWVHSVQKSAAPAPAPLPKHR